MAQWIEVVSWAALAVGAIFASVMAYDIFGRGYRQKMKVMDAVWPITGLYFGPVALAAYLRWGRCSSQKWRDAHGDPDEKPRWATVFTGVCHCGGGCTLGDIVGAWLVFAIGLQFAANTVLSEFIVDYALALLAGIAFQYFAIVPMRNLDVADGIVTAAKADFISLTAFEVGMFGWMALVQFVLIPEHLHPDSAVFWAAMQIGMILGFLTAFPANWWLISAGVKEAM